MATIVVTPAANTAAITLAGRTKTTYLSGVERSLLTDLLQIQDPSWLFPSHIHGKLYGLPGVPTRAI